MSELRPETTVDRTMNCPHPDSWKSYSRYAKWAFQQRYADSKSCLINEQYKDMNYIAYFWFGS